VNEDRRSGPAIFWNIDKNLVESVAPSSSLWHVLQNNQFSDPCSLSSVPNFCSGPTEEILAIPQ
jgi:hypothetical protein